MIKKLIAVTIASLALVACSNKVDRAGTRDNIVKTLEGSGFVVDKTCVDDALDQYSDDELKKIDDDLKGSDSPSAESQALIEQLFTCASVDTGPATSS
jgi:hypothetical protein